MGLFQDWRNLSGRAKSTAAGLLVGLGMVLGAGTVSAQDAAAVVGMTSDLKFDPPSVTISVGDTVEWRNTSQTVHTVTADPNKARDPEHVHLPAGAETFDSGVLQPGETFRYTFEVAGDYTYFCIPHEMQGMVAEVTVEP